MAGSLSDDIDTFLNCVSVPPGNDRARATPFSRTVGFGRAIPMPVSYIAPRIRFHERPGMILKRLLPYVVFVREEDEWMVNSQHWFSDAAWKEVAKLMDEGFSASVYRCSSGPSTTRPTGIYNVVKGVDA